MKFVNCGYDPTCAGWVIRDETNKHIATCRSEALANEFVELLSRSEPPVPAPTSGAKL